MADRRPRSQSPWRTPKVGRSESIALPPKSKSAPADDSWWTKYATPETSFGDFSAAAAARDAEMCATSSEWRRQKVAAIGQWARLSVNGTPKL